MGDSLFDDDGQSVAREYGPSSTESLRRVWPRVLCTRCDHRRNVVALENPGPRMVCRWCFAKDIKHSTQRGDAVHEEGPNKSVRMGVVRRREVEEMMREIEGTCRNGHDLDVHGRWSSSTTRALHVQCTECRRLSRVREREAERIRRGPAREKRGPSDRCRNGHPRSMSKRDVNGELRCRECDRVLSEHRRALARKRKPSPDAGWKQASGALLADDGNAVGTLNRMIGVPLWNYADGSEADHWPEVDFDWTTDEERMCMLEQLLVEFG